MRKQSKRHILAVAATAVITSTAYATETEGNRLYEEYMAKKQMREERAAEARREFLALPSVTWKHVVTERPPPGTVNWRGGSGTKAHIELTGKTQAFAERYTQQEIAVGLWDTFDDKKRGGDLAAIVYGMQKINTGGHFPNNDCLDRAKRTLAVIWRETTRVNGCAMRRQGDSASRSLFRKSQRVTRASGCARWQRGG
ncbi:MAG: hypothetical protein FWG50_04770 [Kiritimatiellaeota bacterium]|nr:hypothetical protein [Kiritimatiellota bacterium]